MLSTTLALLVAASAACLALVCAVIIAFTFRIHKSPFKKGLSTSSVGRIPASRDGPAGGRATRTADRPRSNARPSELTAAARIERTMGPGPTMAWITGPSGIPASGVLGQAEPVAAYAPKQGAANPAFMSGRGLY